MVDKVSGSGNEDAVGTDRKFWQLSTEERRRLEAAGGLVLVVAGLVQVIGTTGESPVRSILFAAVTIAIGGVTLVLATRFANAFTKTLGVNIVLAGCVLVVACVLGGIGGYLISHASR